MYKDKAGRRHQENRNMKNDIMKEKKMKDKIAEDKSLKEDKFLKNEIINNIFFITGRIGERNFWKIICKDYIRDRMFMNYICNIKKEAKDLYVGNGSRIFNRMYAVLYGFYQSRD